MPENRTSRTNTERSRHGTVGLPSDGRDHNISMQRRQPSALYLVPTPQSTRPAAPIILRISRDRMPSPSSHEPLRSSTNSNHSRSDFTSSASETHERRHRSRRTTSPSNTRRPRYRYCRVNGSRNEVYNGESLDLTALTLEDISLMEQQRLNTTRQTTHQELIVNGIENKACNGPKIKYHATESGRVEPSDRWRDGDVRTDRTTTHPEDAGRPRPR